MTALLKTKSLSFRYKATAPWLFKNLDFSLQSGEIVVLTGPSGSGKSTFARCLCGIIPLVFSGELEGKVFLQDTDLTTLSLPQIALHLGYVFQEPEYQLFSHTVIDELAFGLENLCLSPPEIDRRINKVLKLVDMEKYRFAHPQELSGGQQLRIALAAVLAMQPKILLLDEVMASLDSAGRNLVANILIQQREQGCGILMIEHQQEVRTLADRVLALDQGYLQPIRRT